MREWGGLAVVAVLFVGFCLAFNLATPYRKPGYLVHQNSPNGGRLRILDIGAPDERQHANYVDGLLKGEGFPVLRIGDEEHYQAHQPPTYYVIAAGWCKVFGLDPTSESGGFGLRLLNMFVGLGTMAGLFYGAKWVFGNVAVATASAAFMLLPMNVALNSACSNDPLLFCLCTWAMALLGLAVSAGWTPKLALAVGLVTGLALVTKTTAVALLPCVLLALVLVWKDSAKRPKPGTMALALAVPLVLAIPWWMRNTTLYGDPLAVKAFATAFAGSPQAKSFIDALGPFEYWGNWVLWWTARSTVGVFSAMDIFMFEQLGMNKSSSLYLAILFILAIPIGAGMFDFIAKSKEDSGRRLAVVVWFAFALLIFVLLIRFNMQYFQGQARYLYPAIAPVAWCGAIGLHRLMKGNSVLTWAPLALFLSLLDLTAHQQIVQGFLVRL